MSTIFGIVSKNGHELDPSWLELMQNDLCHGNPDKIAVWKNSRVGLGNLQVYNTAESLTETLPYNQRESGVTICSDSRIDNRERMAVLLNIHESELVNLPDSALLLKGYQKWGTDCTLNFRGDFSFAVYNENLHQLLLARDHFGMRPLFYYDDPEYFVFSSELRGILTLPFFEKRVNSSWLLHFLINVEREESDTFYCGIRALPPGHHLVLEDGVASLKKYWELTIPEQLILKDDQEYIGRYRALFERAVSVRSRSAFPVGAELSGGLDSSSIASFSNRYLLKKNDKLHVFARVLPTDPHFGPGKPENDETREIRLVCDFCGISDLHWITMEDQKITDSIRFVTGMMNTPCFSNYATYNLNLIQCSGSAGIRTVLSGHGGDQMLTNPGYFVYQDYLKKRMYWKLFADIRAKGTHNELSVLRAFKQLAGMRRRGNGQGNKRREINKLYRLGIRKELIDRFNLESIYKSHREMAIFSPGGTEDLVLKISHKHMNDRIEATAIVAGHHQVEFRYPMFDVDLIEFYLSIPDGLKYKFRTGRYIHRMAMQGALPHEIQFRKDKSCSINPGLARMFSNDVNNIKENFSTLPTAPTDFYQQLFDPAMMQKLIDDEPFNMYEYKSVINKYFQLKLFEKIIEKIFG